MIPLRLELRGFTCFRETAIVDFSDMESDLFAIAGPTGSGKSTLLDAITYALYGQTARLGSRGVLDALVSPGVERMEVQLAFRADGGTFRVTRVVTRRPSGTVSDVRLERLGPDAAWKILPESEKIKSANDKVERLVGLDYNGFSRAVLLPQGAFDQFLRGDAAERRRLLARLLGLDTVEAVGRRAGQEARAAQAAVEGIDTRLAEDYGGATPERRRELSDALGATRAAAAEVARALAGGEERERALARLRDLVRARREADAELERLERRRPDIVRSRERLRAGRDAALLAPQLERLERQRARRAGLAERRETAATEAERAAAALAAAERRRREAQAAQEEAEPGIAEALTALAAAAPAAARLARLARGLPAAGDPQALAERSDGEAFDEGAFDEVQAARASLPGLRRAAQERRRAAAALAEARRAAAAERKETEAAATEMERILAEGTAAKEALERAQAALRAAEVEHRAAALRADLHEGDPCPVCGRPVAELPAGEQGDLERLRAEVESRAEVRQTLLDRYSEARQRRGRADERASARRDEASRAEEALARASDELRGAVAALPATLRPERTEAAGDGADPLDDLDPAALERRLDARAADHLARLAAEVRRATGGRDPEVRKRELETERARLQRARREADAAHAEAQRRADAAAQRLAGLDEQIAAAAEDLGEAETGFAEALAASGFEDAAAVAAARLEPAAAERLEGEVTAFEDAERAAQRRAAEAAQELGGASYDAEAHRALEAELRELRERQGALATERGRAEAELKRVEEQLERARELRAERRAAEARYDTYRTLQQDLRGNNFPDYLMTRVQQRLAAHASTIVRNVTDGRYDLRLVDGEYHVRDGWADGELRSAKTLSGGETFIASLALALALSDTLAGSRTLGALFLDEGFGTLDRLTLDSVATVLENLASGGRIVGIITHVGELTERMPARLRVHKGPDGSHVAWEV